MSREAFGPHIRKMYTYRELPIGATSIGIHEDVIKTGSWRTLRPVFEPKTAPCNEACPAGVDVRGFISLMKSGLFEDAHRLYVAENPFPGICGRVCFHPCERACNRKDFDEAVGINALERFLGDFTAVSGKNPLPTGKMIGVVGSGPAGLSCAYFLSKLGHRVKVFETSEQIGGVLRVGIPRYRLPSEVVDSEIRRLYELGVEFFTNHKVTRENWRTLQSFDAILLAHGAWRHPGLPFLSEGLPDGALINGLDFLRDIKQGKKVNLGQRVVVIGGGNTAIDVARTCLRLGALTTVLYRRSREEMPAFHVEVEWALEEGVKMLFLISPAAVEKTAGGLRVRCQRNRLIRPDESGRATPVPVEGSEFFIEADSLVIAIGEIPDVSFLPDDVRTIEHHVQVNEFGSTTARGVFASGDLIGQPRTVAHAIGSGKRAAIAIDCFLKDQSLEEISEKLKIGEKGSVSFEDYLSRSFSTHSKKVIRFDDLNPAYFSHQTRYRRHKQLKAGVTNFDEIHGNLTKEEALSEAQRCFSCGRCYGCDNCYLFCPDGSVSHQEEGKEKSVNFDYCKGCGICSNECPVGIISMERED